MKIEITYSELCAILSRSFNCTVESINIINGTTLAQKCIAAVTKLNYKGNEKISAIKALREVFPCNEPNRSSTLGLAEAKWAVENWEKWIEFVKQNNRVPANGYCYNNILV